MSKSVLFSVGFVFHQIIQFQNYNSLVLEVLDLALHVPQLSIQLHLLISQAIELSAQVSNVGLKHSIDVGVGGGLFLEETPFGLQHLVLLFQETHLWKERKNFVVFI